MTNDKLTINEYDSSNDRYPEFEQAVALEFASKLALDLPLFTTNVDKDAMWEAYLMGLPEEARQHYTCNTCRHFIQRFGGLVMIDAQGDQHSMLWAPGIVPPFFQKSVAAMHKLVMNAQVNGVFVPESTKLGQYKTGEWTHLFVEVSKSMVHKSRTLTAYQVAAQKRQDFEMLINALQSYSADTVDQALALINSETMYRSDKVQGVAKWFRNVIATRDNASNSTRKRNVVWSAVATAPNGHTHIRSSMIGTLLEDIAEGLSARVVSARFAEKMNPENYMRSQSAPSSTAIVEAEKLVEKLGIADSLRRKYAKFEDIPTWLWKGKDAPLPITEHKTGVFSHLVARSATGTSMIIPAKTMTWDKFQRTVLPTADKLEVLVDNPSRMMALVTEAVPNSPNILQWDNPFSWYYHGGIDGEIKRRVESAGGRYENNEIRASLIWEGYTDLDLHVITPDNTHISFSRPRSHCGGWLDIDMNGGSHRNASPVENIRWASNAPNGKYKVYVHNYCERGTGKTPYTVELEIAGQTFTFNGIAGGTNYTADAFIFEYEKGKAPKILSQTYTADNSWNVPTGEFVKVKGITESPNLWSDRPVTHSGTHTFFILEGAKDDSEGKGRGFFNEILKSDLRPMRKTLELYTGSTPIEGVDEATACGVGYSKDSEWNLTLKVTSGNSSRLVKIDRWD